MTLTKFGVSSSFG